jgi:hypothetical protein
MGYLNEIYEKRNVNGIKVGGKISIRHDRTTDLWVDATVIEIIIRWAGREHIEEESVNEIRWSDVKKYSRSLEDVGMEAIIKYQYKKHMSTHPLDFVIEKDWLYFCEGVVGSSIKRIGD